MLIILILIMALSAQLIAACLAMNLIALTGKKLAWYLIASALLLMAVRRALPLYHIISQNSTVNPDISQEAIGLLLSILMAVGIAGIKPVFIAIRKNEEALRTALKEKISLLQELYHRTRNNMQVICAMLNLYAIQAQDSRIKVAFRDMENRIHTMALAHQQLFQNQDLSRINLKDYVLDLINLLKRSYLNSDKKIIFKTALSDAPLLIDTAIPCGLLINEVIMNSIQHAFPNQQSREINISLSKKENEQIEVVISDNGVGLPRDFDWKSTNSMGIQTIKMLGIMQLKGRIDFITEQGTKFEFCFKDDLYQERI